MNGYVSNTVIGAENAIWFITNISIVLGLCVLFVMFFFLWKFNKKRHPVPNVDLHGHFWLEITWSVVPVFIVMAMFVVGWNGFAYNRRVPRGTMEIEVVGRQFQWEYTYPGGKLSTNKEILGLVVPINKPIKLNLSALDVSHSFFIPAFRIKEDAVPGASTYLSFTALKTGTYRIYCAEYCGREHSEMKGNLTVLSTEDYYKWFNERKPQAPIKIEDVFEPPKEWITEGKAVYDLQCASCHGNTGLGDATPDARNFHSLDKWVNGSKVSQMFRTLDVGLNKKMPSFSYLSYEQRLMAIHYARTFLKGAEHPKDTSEEMAKLDEEFAISIGKAVPPSIKMSQAITALIMENGNESSINHIDEKALAEINAKHPDGAKVFQENCMECHGVAGQGGQVVAILNEMLKSGLQTEPIMAKGSDWNKSWETLREQMKASSIATGGIKPDFSTLSKKDWQSLNAYLNDLGDAIIVDAKIASAQKDAAK